jgi:hypothetical protein
MKGLMRQHTANYENSVRNGQLVQVECNVDMVPKLSMHGRVTHKPKGHA